MRVSYVIVFVSDMSRSVPRTEFGARQAQYADPDGLPISVGEGP